MKVHIFRRALAQYIIESINYGQRAPCRLSFSLPTHPCGLLWLVLKFQLPRVLLNYSFAYLYYQRRRSFFYRMCSLKNVYDIGSLKENSQLEIWTRCTLITSRHIYRIILYSRHDITSKFKYYFEIGLLEYFRVCYLSFGFFFPSNTDHISYGVSSVRGDGELPRTSRRFTYVEYGVARIIFLYVFYAVVYCILFQL